MDSKFVIFGQERAGTTSLISALNKNDRIVHEPLSSLTGDLEHNPAYREIIEKHGMNPRNLPQSNKIPYFNKFNAISEDKDKCFKFLDSLFEQFDGVKHVWCTVAEEGNYHLLYYCAGHGINIVFQYRESAFFPAISWQLANQASTWQLGEKKEHRHRIDSTKYTNLDEGAIKRRVAWYKKMIPEYHDWLPRNHLVSKYEDLFGLDRYEDRLKRFKEIGQYLNLTYPEDFDLNNVKNFLGTDRRVFGDTIYEKVDNYQEMFEKYGEERVSL